MLRIAPHMPGSNHIETLKTVQEKGWGTAQVFICSPQRLPSVKDTATLEAAARIIREKAIILAVHAPFIANPASQDQKRFKQSLGIMKTWLKFVDIMKADYAVVHPGSGSIEAVIESMAYLAPRCSARILLETDAGSKNGTRVGSVVNILKMVKELKGSVGWAFDSAHAYSNGLNLSDKALVEKIIRKGKPELIHLNDPDQKVVLGGHLDRHNCLFGEGKLGKEPLLHIARLAQELSIPMIVENSWDVAVQNVEYICRELL